MLKLLRYSMNQTATRRQIISFIWVGGINTIFGYSLYAFFIFMGIRYFIAVLFSTLCGIVFNFFTTGRIVFKQFNAKSFFKYLLLYVVLYFISISCLKMLNRWEVNFYYSGFIVIISLSGLSFVLSKYFVFREVKENHV